MCKGDRHFKCTPSAAITRQKNKDQISPQRTNINYSRKKTEEVLSAKKLMHNFPFQDSPNVRLRPAELYVQLVQADESLLCCLYRIL